MEFLVYIAGPVNALAYEAAQARNASHSEALADIGLVGVDPLAFQGAEKLQGLVGNLDDHAERLGLTTKAGIVRTCLSLIKVSDAVFFDLRGLENPSHIAAGTFCELSAASIHFGKPCVVLCHPSLKSAWIETLATVTHSLPGAHAALLKLQQDRDLRDEALRSVS